jgi:hypothetical protein
VFFVGHAASLLWRGILPIIGDAPKTAGSALTFDNRPTDESAFSDPAVHAESRQTGESENLNRTPKSLIDRDEEE